MKKMILGALMALFAVSANAQIVTSRSESFSVTREQKAPSNNYWYVRGGLGINGVSIEDYDTKSKVGYVFGLGHAWMLGAQGAHLDLELGFSTRGFKEDDGDYKESLTAHQVNLTPSFGWKFQVADGISIDPHVGLFVGYDMFGKYTEEEYGDKESYNLGDIDDYNHFDAGGKFGIGVWFHNINLDFSYKTSFTNMVDDYGKAHSFDISVAYAF